MKASRYNVITFNPESGEAVLQNTLYGSRTRCHGDEVGIARAMLDSAVLDDAGALGETHARIRDVLFSQKHLVEDDADELSIVRNRKLAGIRDGNRLDVILMPTLDCNMACVYCYESHARSRMTDQTENALGLWLQQEMPRHKVTLLSWFGGEPLMAFNRVLSITQHAVETAARARVGCLTHMTTNGSLLNPTRSRRLVDAGLRDYQITVDGTRETHDSLRPGRGGVRTYDRVFANIVDLVGTDPLVNVSLRVNFNHVNLRSIPNLLEAFPERCRPQLRPVFEPIFGARCVSATANLENDEISSALADYYGLASELGYNVVHGTSDLGPGRLVYCYAERENQVVVSFNGDVYKCSVADFAGESRFGYIREDGTLVKEDRWDEWMSDAPFEGACENCVYLPTCMGGCRKERRSADGAGSVCSLVPTNASYLLKQIAFGSLRGDPTTGQPPI